MTDALATNADSFQEDKRPNGDDPDAGPAADLNDEQTVPLDLLDEGGDDNVRRSASKVEIEALMLSMMHTHRRPLQALVVAEVDGRYKVGAGNRRLRGLKLAAKRGLIPKNHPVPVRFALPEELHEISLTENVMRVALHPVDEFEAFSHLRDAGVTIPEIADRFGLKEIAVRQRLALGGLAPEIRKAWRDGRIGQEQAQDYTLCDDHDVQRQALKAGTASKGHYSGYEVRRILQAGRDNTNSGRFAFVGREAYLAAGGALREDLFGDVILVEDPDILTGLYTDKIEAIRHELVTDQGWSFAVHRDEVERAYSWNSLPLDPWMTPEERAVLSKSSNTSWSVRRDLIKRVSEIPEARAASGVIFDVSHDGSLHLDTLRLKPAETDSADDEEPDDIDDPDDEEPDSETFKVDAGGEPSDSPPAPEGAASSLVQSKPLLEDLSEQLGDAIAECLVAEPELALLAVTAALRTSRWGSPLRLAKDGSPARKSHSETPFIIEFARLGALTYDEVLGELARAVAGALETRASQVEVDRNLQDGIAALVGRIQPEAFRAALSRSFQVGSFFDRAPGAVAKAAAEEAGAGTIKGKKSELAERATEIAQKTGWLPPSLRTVHYQAPGTGGGQ